MRRYQGCGPFLPPDSNWEASGVKDAEEALKDNDAGADATPMNGPEKPVQVQMKARTRRYVEYDKTLDDLVKMLPPGEIGATNDQKLAELRKELEEGILDPDDLVFDLLRVFSDDLKPLKDEASGVAGPAPDKRVIVPPPSSVSSGYNSASSVGSLSPPGPSVKDIKTEKNLEDEDHVDMAFLLESIKKEPEEVPDDDADMQRTDDQDNLVKLSVDDIKKEQEAAASGGLEAGTGTVEIKSFEVSGDVQADLDAYILLKHYYAQYESGEWESGEIEPSPEARMLELAYAVSQLEEEMKLEDHEKTVQVERIDEVEEAVENTDDEEPQGEGGDEDQDEDDQMGDDEDETDVEEDSGMEDGYLTV